MRQKLIEVQGETNESLLHLETTASSISIEMDKSNKQEMSKDIFQEYHLATNCNWHLQIISLNKSRLHILLKVTWTAH
jgi:hypothetical protein